MFRCYPFSTTVLLWARENTQLKVKLSSKYNYLSELSVLKLYDVVTIYEIKRKYDLFEDNISVNKSVQVHVMIGKLVPYLVTYNHYYV